MEPDLDGRTYDLLWLVDRHEPVGSIRLVELMRQHGYSITGRTIRLTLAELDDAGLTEKVPGKGRQLTDHGRAELDRGNVSNRLERVRSRIATLTSQVSYDPLENTGVLIVSSAFIDASDRPAAIETIQALDASPLGPIPAAVEPISDDETEQYHILVPSSLTLDGVLLSHGINTDLRTAGVAAYTPPVPEGDRSEDSETGSATHGGTIDRYVDVLNGEGASVDVLSLLIEAGRSNVTPVLEADDRGELVVDYREFPLTRFEEARDLATATRNELGGVIDIRRPREGGPFPLGPPGWEFAATTYGGTGELVIAALSERDITTEWETVYGTVDRNRLVTAARLDPTGTASR